METEGESKSDFGRTTAARICLTPLKLRESRTGTESDGLGSPAFVALRPGLESLAPLRSSQRDCASDSLQ